jgi:hypothetical protein
LDDSRPDVVEKASPCTKVGVARVVVVQASEEIEESFWEVEDFEDDEDEGVADRWEGRTEVQEKRMGAIEIG